VKHQLLFQRFGADAHQKALLSLILYTKITKSAIVFAMIVEMFFKLNVAPGGMDKILWKNQCKKENGAICPK
jgi:hypothetical protein